MPEQRLTPAQYRTLEEVEAARIRWASQEREFYTTAWTRTIRPGVMGKIVALGFAEIGDSLVGNEISPRVLLTNKGREALAQHRSQS